MTNKILKSTEAIIIFYVVQLLENNVGDKGISFFVTVFGVI